MTFTLHWPQTIWILLSLWSLTNAFIHHGETEKGKVNAYNSFLGSALAITILYWGGFFHG